MRLHSLHWSLGLLVNEDGSVCTHDEMPVLNLRTCERDPASGDPLWLSLVLPHGAPATVRCEMCGTTLPVPSAPWEHPAYRAGMN